jgi:hypothetical protein
MLRILQPSQASLEEPMWIGTVLQLVDLLRTCTPRCVAHAVVQHVRQAGILRFFRGACRRARVHATQLFPNPLFHFHHGYADYCAQLALLESREAVEPNMFGHAAAESSEAVEPKMTHPFLAAASAAAAIAAIADVAASAEAAAPIGAAALAAAEVEAAIAVAAASAAASAAAHVGSGTAGLPESFLVIETLAAHFSVE